MYLMCGLLFLLCPFCFDWQTINNDVCSFSLCEKHGRSMSAEQPSQSTKITIHQCIPFIGSLLFEHSAYFTQFSATCRVNNEYVHNDITCARRTNLYAHTHTHRQTEYLIYIRSSSRNSQRIVSRCVRSHAKYSSLLNVTKLAKPINIRWLDGLPIYKCKKPSYVHFVLFDHTYIIGFITYA